MFENIDSCIQDLDDNGFLVIQDILTKVGIFSLRT